LPGDHRKRKRGETLSRKPKGKEIFAQSAVILGMAAKKGKKRGCRKERPTMGGRCREIGYKGFISKRGKLWD